MAKHQPTRRKPTKRLRFSDLKERNIVRNRVTLQDWTKRRGFPTGHMTGPNSRTWGEDEVEEWLASRPTEAKAPLPLGEGKRRGRPRKNAPLAKAEASGPEA
jgi:hypothetical protein